MTAFDDFTVRLLTNPEVINVDQDPLGRAARRIKQNGSEEIWARPLCDGTKAVGLFNRGALPVTVRLAWKEIGLHGEQPVRDLWQRRNVGRHKDGFETLVQPHGEILLKVGTASGRSSPSGNRN